MATLLLTHLLKLFVFAVFSHADTAIVGPVATATAVVVLACVASAAIAMAVKAWRK